MLAYIAYMDPIGLDPLGSFRHDSIPPGSPETTPLVPHPWATGEDGAGRALAEGIDHMLHLSGIDQGFIMDLPYGKLT